MRRLSAPMTVMAAVIGLLVLAEVTFAADLVARRAGSGAAPQAQASASGHPCNHGFFVSQAAHAKHSGQDVSKVAHSNAGKDGSCTKP